MTGNNDAPPVLELKQVRKTYGHDVAVEAVDLVLRAEEFLTFLGPSGSGKTTTLMMVAGLQKPDSGSIHLAGRAVDRLPPYRRDIGMVFQNYALFPHMTVRRNIAFPLEMRQVGKAEIERQVQDALQLVGLEAFGDRLPRQLSGGQQQRVALARAMVYHPALLLMDEPLGALDKKLREQMQREIKRIHRERRTSVLYVTHDQEEALTMSDRIAVFNMGRIEQIGTPEELYERPQTRFVADFLGETNFLAGQVVSTDAGGTRIDIGSGVVEAVATRPAAIGDAVMVAVRPERIQLIPTSTGGLAGTLTDIVYLGNSRRSVIRLADGRDVLAFHHAGDAMAAELTAGQPVSLSWKQAHATVFPADRT